MDGDAILIAVARADIALCGAERIILRAVIPALIMAVLLFAIVKCKRGR